MQKAAFLCVQQHKFLHGFPLPSIACMSSRYAILMGLRHLQLECLLAQEADGNLTALTTGGWTADAHHWLKKHSAHTSHTLLCRDSCLLVWLRKTCCTQEPYCVMQSQAFAESTACVTHATPVEIQMHFLRDPVHAYTSS